ncbi:hypothetical protein [Arthrobacter antibioticus]|uniref:hypothetical protein n=1 Tax=Arthrobacter sp. H35-MC1 TaxID=3046203 RepID=UPI0024BB7225|nr:hypothetical protein [Arthrobacter sp. H35-MC1]MDJ0318867.1 hypothetical protein [Arthrobacter sp. H35-MC1]
MTDSLTPITIISATDAQLSGEDPLRIESYRRYWAVEGWNPHKEKIVWAETLQEIVKTPGITGGKMGALAAKHPVLIEDIACPDCGGQVYITKRQEAQQALWGDIPKCEPCLEAQAQAQAAKRKQEAKEFAILQKKTQKAFDDILCDDHRPEDCVSNLNHPQVRLYLDMLKMRKERGREYIGDDINGNPQYSEPAVTLWGCWVHHFGDKYKKAGPDLYELARHRIIKPRRPLAESVALTRHGLINPSGYPAVMWEVEEELDGWPLVGIMGRQLQLLGDSAEEE